MLLIFCTMRLTFALCALALLGASVTAAAVDRTYYVQAEVTLWDSGDSDFCGNVSADAPTFTSEALGSVLWKGLYFGYTDATFSTKIERNGSDEHLGILGELIWAMRACA